jgi:hypothetical protein
MSTEKTKHYTRLEWSLLMKRQWLLEKWGQLKRVLGFSPGIHDWQTYSTMVLWSCDIAASMSGAHDMYVTITPRIETMEWERLHPVRYGPFSNTRWHSGMPIIEGCCLAYIIQHPKHSW